MLTLRKYLIKFEILIKSKKDQWRLIWYISKELYYYEIKLRDISSNEADISDRPLHYCIMKYEVFSLIIIFVINNYLIILIYIF